MTAESIVLLFSGQGAQRVGMGRDLVERYPSAKALLEEAEEVLGWSIGEAMFEGPMEELTRTSRCQPALYLHGLMVWRLLQEEVEGLMPVAAAGLSLGEFTAYAAAGSLTFADGLRLVARRGELMEEACESEGGAMVAIIGGEEEAVRKLAGECDVDVANLNAPGQIVLSGMVAGIERAAEGAKMAGAKLAKMLPVAGAYHSRLMRPAQEKLAVELAEVDVRPPDFPVWSNFTATATGDPGEIRRTLEMQVTGTVRWAESMAQLAAQGHRLFLELGPDKALAGMMKRIAPEVEVLSIGSAGDMEVLKSRLAGEG